MEQLPFLTIRHSLQNSVINSSDEPNSRAHTGVDASGALRVTNEKITKMGWHWKHIYDNVVHREGEHINEHSQTDSKWRRPDFYLLIIPKPAVHYIIKHIKESFYKLWRKFYLSVIWLVLESGVLLGKKAYDWFDICLKVKLGKRPWSNSISDLKLALSTKE